MPILHGRTAEPSAYGQKHLGQKPGQRRDADDSIAAILEAAPWGSGWLAGPATITPRSPPDSYQVLCPQIREDNMGTNSRAASPPWSGCGSTLCPLGVPYLSVPPQPYQQPVPLPLRPGRRSRGPQRHSRRRAHRLPGCYPWPLLPGPRVSHTGRTARWASTQIPATYVAFDLLHLDGEDLTGRPLLERERLPDELHLAGPARATNGWYSDGETPFEVCVRRAHEGVGGQAVGLALPARRASSDLAQAQEPVLEARSRPPSTGEGS